MTEHTPGPWVIDPRAGTHIVGVGGRHVASSGGYASNMAHDRDTYIDENAANARLIAAAPDLLWALKDILWYVQTGQGYSREVTMRNAAAAIAKATGND